MQSFYHFIASMLALYYLMTVIVFFSIKTFHDEDFKTSHLFGNLTNAPFICAELDAFYEKKNEQMSIPRCIRFKTTQTLYCHGELDDFGNYSKYKINNHIDNCS